MSDLIKPVTPGEIDPVMDLQLMREVEQGLWETVAIFRGLKIPDAQIAFFFRAIADKLQPTHLIIHEEPELPQ